MKFEMVAEVFPDKNLSYYSPRNWVWSGRVTSMMPVSSSSTHWQPNRELMRGFTALSIKSSSLSVNSSINASPLFTYRWQVLQAHTPPQLWCRSILFFKATSSRLWSCIILVSVIGALPFSSNLKVTVYISPLIVRCKSIRKQVLTIFFYVKNKIK